MKMRRPRFLFRTILSSAIALAGCAAGPNYERPAVSVPAQWSEHGDNEFWKIAEAADTQTKGEWWQLFGDNQLNALQEQAQLGNLNLQAAVARLEQARALAQVSHSALLPTVSLDAQHTRTRSSNNRPNIGGTPINSAQRGSNSIGNDNAIAATANYEIDLFGRMHRLNEASTANAEQAEADLETIKLIIAADVATNYFGLRGLADELAVLDQTLTVQSKILDIVRGRYADGAASGIDLAQQELIVSNNREQRELLLQQYEQQHHALAALLGIHVDGLKINIAPLQGNPPTIPLVMPAELLQRRPDVASAERAVAAANAQIGVAKSAWFPTLNITARDGFESSLFNTLFDAPSAAWAVGASATQTLFNSGASQARVNYAQAKHRETIANYRTTVLTAWREVEDGLSAARMLAAAQSNAQLARVAALKIADITDDRYQAGLASAIERYTARQTALNTQREAAQITAQIWKNAVALVKALGGGWEANKIAQTN